jgi:hypothetical protein
MKSLVFVLAILFSFASFNAVEAKPQGGANQAAIQKAVRQELARQQGQKNRAVNRNRNRRGNLERALRAEQLIDFNRQFIFRNSFVSPFGFNTFGFNPFLGNRFFFQNRNFAIGF